MPGPINYIHLEPESSPPQISNDPTRMVVIVEVEVSPSWQSQVSDWIVQSGCLYMMAWGVMCSSWDDAVDWANITRHGNEPIPEDAFITTTWHSEESLADVLGFCKNLAAHPLVDLQRTILLHISGTENRAQIVQAYKDA